MKKIGKFLYHLIIFFLVAAGIGAAAYYGYRYWQRQELEKARPRLVKAKDGTNINASWHSYPAYQKDLKKNFSFIAQNSRYVPPRTWVGKDVIVPGLQSTKSYDFKNKKFDTADSMTPQGIAVAGKYLLLTAYDGQREHASVIYVLDSKTGKYLKTVQIQGRPHLGGIAYDEVAQNIWLTGSKNGNSALMCFSLQTLKNYNAKHHVPIEYKYQIEIPTVERASTVTYFDNQLFVGFFNMYGRGKVASYAIKRGGKNSGSITNNEIKAVTGTVSWSDPSGETSMDKQIQGIAFYQNRIFLSQSYGSGPSKLYVFPTTALSALNEQNAELVIDLPPYLEQIAAYKGQLLCIFESGSKLYARPQLVIMDRILSLNINALFDR
ncbi:hypothetical protein PT285_10395 [Lactobacillus sp. ESL0791]|uniref:YncE family protein n=1 Tax=Lactobacillus sp. ESL0791 TaxID=2983234 RepID=UPI0023F62935|nr:hypothetical protein [Lactobacillus sp. ESL0791]MDF7639809.1 hypothetical protein [Lactobacillus sp. ESL0791]